MDQLEPESKPLHVLKLMNQNRIRKQKPFLNENTILSGLLDQDLFSVSLKNDKPPKLENITQYTKH